MPKKKIIDEQPSEIKASDLPDLEDDNAATPNMEVEKTGEDEEQLDDEVMDTDVETIIENAETPAKVWPKIQAGVCEFCGVRLFAIPDLTQEKAVNYHKTANCGHRHNPNCEPNCPNEHAYKGDRITCTYCKGSRETLAGRTLYVYSLPENPNKIIVCCDDYKCMNRHQLRFKKSTT